MKARGFTYITNGLVQKFLLSPQGFLMIVISLIMGIFVVLIQLGGQIVLAHQLEVGNKEIRFVSVVKYTLSRLKYMLGVDGLMITFYFVLLAPLLGLNVKTTIFEELKIPGFIMQSIEANNLYYFMLVMLASIILYLSFRWMFALQALILDVDSSKKFLKRSKEVKKGQMKKVFKFFVSELLLGIMVIFGAIVTTLLLTVIVSLVPNISEEVVIQIVFSITLIITFLLSVISGPLVSIQMTKLYHLLSGQVNELPIKYYNKRTLFNKVLTNKFIVVVVSTVVVAVGFLYGFFIDSSFVSAKYTVGITAHRGSSFEAPENTLSAIDIAMKNGATHVEIDVQLTKDGHLILLHDKTFLRTTGVDKRADQLTLKQVQTLDSGSWFDEKYASERIPTLSEIIEYTRDKIILNIEIKGSNYSPNVVDEVARSIEQHNIIDQCVVTSLNYDDLERIEVINSKIKTGYIMFVAIGQLKDLNIDFYSVEATNVTDKFIRNAHSLNREVHVWTINSVEDMEEMLSLGVDNIITDNDKVLYELINSKK